MIASIRKVSVIVIKCIVGFIPYSIRNYLKKNPKLTSFYSRLLQRSGLFYGFPSETKLQALYFDLMQRQNESIQDIVGSFFCSKNIDVFLIVSDSLNIEMVKILTSNTLINEIYLLGSDKQFQKMLNKSQVSLPFLKPSEYVVDRPVLLLRTSDYLHKHAIEIYLRKLSELDMDSVLLYSDIDCIDSEDLRYAAEFYPDWNPDLQLSTGYIKSGVVISSKFLIDDFLDFQYIYDPHFLISTWIACLYLKSFDLNVFHISIPLVHQTKTLKERTWSDVQLAEEFEEFSLKKSSFRGVMSFQWCLEKSPLVSLIIPTNNAKELVKSCIESIISKTTYKNFEILLIDNNSNDIKTLEYFNELNRHPKISVLKYPYPFNYSAINNFAVTHAKGDVIGLINNDIEVISPDWLSYMVGHVMRDDIGCVGAKLLYPDGRIQHAGVVMGYGGGAGHAHKYFPRHHTGYLNRLAATNNFSAVTAACLLVKKADYEAVGGLNDIDLQVAFNDVDFCLKVLELGRRNLYCAEAELYHHESVSRGLDDNHEKRLRFESELQYLRSKWMKYIKCDPAYNVNLTLRRENFSIRE